MIKVTKTKQHITIDGLAVPVVEGKLLFIELQNYHKSWIKNSKTPIAPVLISEDEDIIDGDFYINEKNELYKMTNVDWANKNNGWYGNKFFKILTLPEHFSPIYLQLIAEGKFREGDKRLIECVYDRKTDFKIRGIDDTLVISDDFLCIIKHEPHITLYDPEEKTIPLSLVEKAFNDARIEAAYLSTAYEYPTFKDWSKKFIK